MTNFFKKYPIQILCVFGLLIILSGILIFTNTPPAPIIPAAEDTDYLVTDLNDGWSQYTDIPFVFSIEFPSAHGERPFVETHSPGNYPDFYSVGFRAQPEDMVMFGVMVIPTGFADAEAWLADRMKNNHEFNEYMLERRVQIANQEALVTYWRETPENEASYENRERQTAFSRNGTIYIISTRGMSLADTERAWRSFQFLEPDISNPPALIDGKEYYPGTYYDSSVVNGMKFYLSEWFDISFNYPEGYLLFESEVKDEPQAQFSFVAGSIVLGLDLPVRQSIMRAEAGRGGGAPGSIVLTFYQPQDQSLSLEEWLRSNPSGNFNPEFAPDAEHSLMSTTIAGMPALKYHSDFGMYPTDYVAFTYKDWYVLASDATDAKNDFEKVLSTIVIQ
jgi:hypothetical protein